MLEKITKVVQGLEIAIFTAMVGYGEYIQNEVLLGNRQYSWFVGHCTDIGYCGGVTAFVLTQVSRAKFKVAMAIPTAFSGIEALTALHPKINFDIEDVLCYYGAALFAYGVNRACTALSRK